MHNVTGQDIIKRYFDVEMGGTVVARAYVEIRVNPHHPRNMEADLHFDRLNLPLSDSSLISSSNITLNSPDLKVELLDIYNMQISSPGIHIISASVKSITRHYTWLDDSACEAYFNYRFPLVGAL